MKYDDKLLYNDKLWSVMQGDKLYFNRLMYSEWLMDYMVACYMRYGDMQVVMYKR